WSQFSKYLPSQAKANLSRRGWWIGGTYDKEAATWRWVNGEPFEYSCWSGASMPPPNQGPRIRQHDNGGGGGGSPSAPPPPPRGPAATPSSGPRRGRADLECGDSSPLSVRAERSPHAALAPSQSADKSDAL